MFVLLVCARYGLLFDPTPHVLQRRLELQAIARHMHALLLLDLALGSCSSPLAHGRCGDATRNASSTNTVSAYRQYHVTAS